MRWSEREGNLLNKTVTTAAARVILLQLDKLELAEGLENILEILLRNAEVDVAHIQAVERNRVRVATRCFRSSGLVILLSLGELDDDRGYLGAFGQCELKRASDGIFVFEFNITNPAGLAC